MTDYPLREKEVAIMGLKMSGKKVPAQEIYTRYRIAGREDRNAILNEFVKTTSYNRNYAIRLLNQIGKTRLVSFNGKPVYDFHTVDRLQKLWAFFWYKCGK
jgi:hypothetical protein